MEMNLKLIPTPQSEINLSANRRLYFEKSAPRDMGRAPSGERVEISEVASSLNREAAAEKQAAETQIPYKATPVNQKTNRITETQ